MSHIMRWISRFTLLSMLMFGAGSCAIVSEEKASYRIPSPAVQVFYSPFDKVWRAAQLAIAHYPPRVNNMDTGILETEVIKGLSSKSWQGPHQARRPPAGMKYQIRVVVSRGDVDGKEATQVIVQKNIKIKRDFFAAEEELQSDGLEERSIVYRIERELKIDRALERAAKANTTNPSPNPPPKK